MDETDEYIQDFKQTDIFTELFRMTSDFVENNDTYEETEVVLNTNHNFEEKNVSQSDDMINVKLIDRRDSGYRTILKCTYIDGSITKAYMDIGQQSGPLAGRGYRVTYSDGEYNSGCWIS
jgi:hypothetical protein